jgi:hypothetical protein
MTNQGGLTKKSLSLACGYGVVLGVYFGLIIGFRINPDFLDHYREVVYAALIVLFGAVLHSSRNLAGGIAWTAYGLCCVTHILVAAACDHVAILKIPHVGIGSLPVIGFFVLGGFVAQGLGVMVRKCLLPPQDVTGRFMERALPWLPLLVLLAMTLHTAEHQIAYGDIRTQRSQSEKENDYLRAVAIAAVAESRTVRLEDGDLSVIAALAQNVFPSGEKIEAILAFHNRGKATVTIAAPGSFAAFFAVRDAAGRKIPFIAPAEWQVSDRLGPAIAVPSGGHAGLLVAMQPYYSIETPGTYTLYLNWRGQESDALTFTVR